MGKGTKTSSPNETNEIIEELTPVELLDTVQVKQTLDTTLQETLEALPHGQDLTLDNLKMALMTVACIFACAAQFAPIPFPEQRWTLGACVGCYFACSGLLSAVAMFIEKDYVFASKPIASKSGEYTFRVQATLPRFCSTYTVTLEADFSGTVKSTEKHEWSIGEFFTEEGFFDEDGFAERIETTANKFNARQTSKSD